MNGSRKGCDFDAFAAVFGCSSRRGRVEGTTRNAVKTDRGLDDVRHVDSGSVQGISTIVFSKFLVIEVKSVQWMVNSLKPNELELDITSGVGVVDGLEIGP